MPVPKIDRSHTPKGRRAREGILSAAEPLLATRGFHGSSMRDIAAAAGLPLATVVYHFAKKEQLYAAVLSAISAELERVLDQATGAGDKKARIGAFAAKLVRWMLRHPARVQLLMREVIDNPARVARASHLPLAGFLVKAGSFITEVRDPADGGHPVLAFLHLFGGVSYVIAARPTLARMRQRSAGRGTPVSSARYESDAVAFVCRVLGARR